MQCNGNSPRNKEGWNEDEEEETGGRERGGKNLYINTYDSLPGEEGSKRNDRSPKTR